MINLINNLYIGHSPFQFLGLNLSMYPYFGWNIEIMNKHNLDLYFFQVHSKNEQFF